MLKKRRTISLKWLLLGVLITNTAMSFIWPLNTIYIHETLHKSLVVAASVLFLNQLATMLGSLIGGKLFDTWSPYYSILLGIILNIFALGGLIFFHAWPAYALLLILSGLANGISVTCENSLATRVGNHRSSYVFNLLYFASNFGLVFGTLTVGYIMPLGIAYVFAIATIIQVLFLVVAVINYNIQFNQTMGDRNQAIKKGKLTPKILGALIMVLICWLIYEQWQSNLSTFMVEKGFKVKSYSFLWTFNAILIVLFQPVVTHFDELLLKHIRGRLNIGILLLLASFALLLLPFKDNYGLYVTSMCLLTLGEILLFPGVASFVDIESPKNLTGYYQGRVQMFSALGKAIGPLFGALIIDNTNYEFLFLICVLMAFLSLLIFTLPVISASKNSKFIH